MERMVLNIENSKKQNKETALLKCSNYATPTPVAVDSNESQSTEANPKGGKTSSHTPR